MIHSFLEFQLDEERFELRRAGEVVPLQARVFKLLTYLARHHERVVSKRELNRSVWEASVVTETAVSQAIMMARKALGDEQQQLIRTVRGQGFRLHAPVLSSTQAARATTLEAQPNTTPVSTSATLETERPPSILPSLAPLHGRARELTQLQGFAERAARGRGALVVIEGQPGIGKSRLVEHFAVQLRAQQVEVASGKAWEAGGAPPYWPWTQILRSLLHGQPLSPLREQLGPSLDEVLSLLPEHGAHASQTASGARPESEGAHLRFRLFDAMARLLRVLCASTPKVTLRLMLLEDLHAMDEGSVQMARFLSQELAELPILVVATYRALEVAPRSALAELLASLSDTTQRIVLSGLTVHELGSLVETRLSRVVPQRWLETMHRVSLGNPLLMNELLHRVLIPSDGELPEFPELLDMPLPERIERAVNRQLQVLPEQTRELLARASVFGREVSLPLLAILEHTSEQAVLERLSPVIERGLLGQMAGRPEQLVFSHILVRSVLYQNIAPIARADCHRQIAELLEQRSNNRPLLHELAHHYFLATSAGTRAKAAHYALRAADHAMNTRGYEVAARLYERAYELQALENQGYGELFELLMSAGRGWYMAGDHKQAVSCFTRGQQLAIEQQHAIDAAHAIGMAAYVTRGTMIHDRSLQQQLRAALETLPEGDHCTKAMLLGVRDFGAGTTSSLPARDAATREAVAMAKRLNDTQALIFALNARHLVLIGLAQPTELLAVANELIDICRGTQNHEALLDALIWSTMDNMALGNLAAIMRNKAEYVSTLELSGSPFHRYIGSLADTAEACMLGNFEKAQEHSVRARDLGLRIQDPLARAGYDLRSLFLVSSSPTTLLAQDLTVDPQPYVPEELHVFWALQWLRDGRQERSYALLRSFASMGFDQPMLDALRLPTWATLSEVCVHADDAEIAEQLYGLLSRYAGQHLMLLVGVYMGPCSLYLGKLALTMRKRELAKTHLNDALKEACSVAALPVQHKIRALLANLS